MGNVCWGWLVAALITQRVKFVMLNFQLYAITCQLCFQLVMLLVLVFNVITSSVIFRFKWNFPIPGRGRCSYSYRHWSELTLMSSEVA